MSRELEIAVGFGSDALARSNPSLHGTLQTATDQIWAKLRSLYHLDIPQPDLVSVRSHVAKPLLLTSDGETPLLVFDQHLIEISMLTTSIRRLNLTEAAHRRALMRLYAERLYCAGRSEDACVARSAAHLSSGETEVVSPASDEVLQALFADCFAQQRAVIAHELTHALIALVTPERRAELARWFVNTAGGVFAGNDTFGSELESQLLGFSSPTDMFNQVIADPVVLEECMCDALSLMGILPALIYGGADVATEAVSVLRSLQTLQIVQLMDLAIGAMGEVNELTMASQVVQGVARQLVFRAFATAMAYQSLDFDVAEAQAVDDAIVQSSSSPVLTYLIGAFGLNTLENNLRTIQWSTAHFGGWTKRQVRDYLRLNDPAISFFNQGVV